MMKRSLAVLAALFVCLTAMCFCAYADSSPAVYLLDEADVISLDNEKVIKTKAQEVAAKTGFNIVVITSKDIGTPKTDAHVVEYADDRYEELCGIDTDGILFLINCDTKYDYISTSGVCINYFSDDRIDDIFDQIWDDLKNENFSQAAYSFVYYVERYYDKGKANHQSYTSGFHLSISMLQPLIFIFFIVLTVGSSTYGVYSSQFKVQPPGTRNYILENSLVFDNSKDVFVGNVVNKTYTPRSSSGSHHSSGHHSSTHRSHSGGHHGGGGRHR